MRRWFRRQTPKDTPTYTRTSNVVLARSVCRLVGNSAKRAKPTLPTCYSDEQICQGVHGGPGLSGDAKAGTSYVLAHSNEMTAFRLSDEELLRRGDDGQTAGRGGRAPGR